MNRTTLRRLAAAATAALLAAGLGGCVVVPQTRPVFDPTCQALTREVTLEVAVIGQFQSCRGDECALMLASAGLVTAVSAVVSGSIALVGNVVYWIELQGRCPARALRAGLRQPPAAVPSVADLPPVPGPATGPAPGPAASP